jgi:hypothetical protein
MLIGDELSLSVLLVAASDVPREFRVLMSFLPVEPRRAVRAAVGE